MEKDIKNQKIKRAIIAVSIIVPLLVGFLNWGLTKQHPDLGFDLHIFPKANAMINATVSFLLIFGMILIKKKKVDSHKKVMILAFSLSVLFLVSYVIYHSLSPSTVYGGEGIMRSFYLFILLTHIVLAAIVMPFILFAFYFALTDQIKKHRKLAKLTWSIWLYVSITGVLVYLMISPYY